MVLKDGDTRHTKINVLARLPFHLRWDCNFDGVLCHKSNSGLVSNHERHTPRLEPVKLEQPYEVTECPDTYCCIKVGPRHEEVLSVPEKETNVDDSHGYVENHKDLIGCPPNKGQ